MGENKVLDWLTGASQKADRITETLRKKEEEQQKERQKEIASAEQLARRLHGESSPYLGVWTELDIDARLEEIKEFLSATEISTMVFTFTGIENGKKVWFPTFEIAHPLDNSIQTISSHILNLRRLGWKQEVGFDN